MGEYSYIKTVRNKEAKYCIINHELHYKGNASQTSYNMPKNFFRDSISKNIIKHNDDLNYKSISRQGEEFTLFACTLDKNEFSFKLGPGVIWLIGNEYDNNDNEFTLVYAKKDGMKYSGESSPQWRTKPQIRPSKYEEWGDGYEWFVKLFNKNIVGNKYFLDIDENNKIITFDILFNSIDSSLGVKDIESTYFDDEYPHNWIFFGAPGTGKSYILNKIKTCLIKNDKDYERVTFHPDYSYANFVGTYKPVSNNSEEKKDGNEKNPISYKFVPGPFIRVLEDSIKDKSHNPHLLIIEEINRSNVGAVFGDVFQLLDRKDGRSEYPIKASEDLQKYLKDIFKDEYEINFPNNEIIIPDNMYIWATMNSADQGVYMMDTAFKRRWDFSYIGINHSSEKIEDVLLFLGEDNKQKIMWNDLREAINEELLKFNVNEDKLIGPFFINPKYLPRKNDLDKFNEDNEKFEENGDLFYNNNNKFKEIFKNKVLMYLFEDVAKPKRKDLFDKGKNEYLLYSDICKRFEKEGIKIFCKPIKDKLIKNENDDAENDVTL